MNIEKVESNRNNSFKCTQTGLIHPADNEPVEFTVTLHAPGAYTVSCPSLSDPDVDEEICIEPSGESEQEAINTASPSTIGEWAVSEVGSYYWQE